MTNYMRTGLLLFWLVLSANVIMAEQVNLKLPEKFLGKFKLDRDENFDDYLEAKGLGWFVRKMIVLVKITKVFAKSETNPDSYDASNFSINKNAVYTNWKLGEKIRAVGFDSKVHEITFTYDPETETLYEKHVRIADPNDTGETYEYRFEGDELVMSMEHKGVKCRRYFKRVKPE